MVKERPILFSAPMVRAILDGTKTQTRRDAKFIFHSNGDRPLLQTCPYGHPSDRLWVREAHWIDRRDPQCAVMDLDGYVIDDHPLGKSGTFVEDMAGLRANTFWRKRPSIHMPRWASRITLEITSVRVERLQDISPEDAVAEGLIRHSGLLETWWGTGLEGSGLNGCRFLSPVQAYRNLWESINGSNSWDANPWVWVVEFKRITP